MMVYEMLDSVIYSYASTGAVLHAALNLPQDDKKYHPRILRLSSASPAWVPLLSRLEVTARQAADNPRCFGPACSETEATAGRKLHVCGGCGHMTYCSKECQRRAWKDQRAPHKPICKLIQDLEASGVRAPVWKGDNIMAASLAGAAPELYRALMTLADHIDQLTA
ncbi:hypothetical protein PUNSTDRAFT_119268 [Punctularia strigosozonata HHB-11173 SS5]|uniref:uncharacterized protein n=1 Tax=Punctularia strigosozonata (strain HHB-11173) TaxID=741275 RepID=UPI0004416E69|nr:uncharacterized protein PUNSTDRAFT_119268 [Punctularia strigosozonata HHB-11173 SS5]EIN10210.1 hypothetical protein PUNSTDRAFT_119268 [Punctularia strigosozonata HHB-11173 SS5]